MTRAGAARSVHRHRRTANPNREHSQRETLRAFKKSGVLSARAIAGTRVVFDGLGPRPGVDGET